MFRIVELSGTDSVGRESALVRLSVAECGTHQPGRNQRPGPNTSPWGAPSLQATHSIHVWHAPSGEVSLIHKVSRYVELYIYIGGGWCG